MQPFGLVFFIDGMHQVIKGNQAGFSSSHADILNLDTEIIAFGDALAFQRANFLRTSHDRNPNRKRDDHHFCILFMAGQEKDRSKGKIDHRYQNDRISGSEC